MKLKMTKLLLRRLVSLIKTEVVLKYKQGKQIIVGVASLIKTEVVLKCI